MTLKKDSFRSYNDDFMRDTGHHMNENIELYIQYIIARNLEKILEQCDHLNNIEYNTDNLENLLKQVLKTVNEIQEGRGM